MATLPELGLAFSNYRKKTKASKGGRYPKELVEAVRFFRVDHPETGAREISEAIEVGLETVHRWSQQIERQPEDFAPLQVVPPKDGADTLVISQEGLTITVSGGAKREKVERLLEILMAG